MAMRLRLKLAAFSIFGTAAALVTPAQAANGSIWDHNGSKMTLEENGEKRKLVYTELREGLDRAGIKKGTVLFNGERKADGRFAGFAKIFKATCNPIDYFVEGTLNEQKGEIVLQGQAPVYTGNGCEVNGYSDSSPASTLTFTRIGDAPESAVVAERTPEPQVEQGDGGQSNDYLPPSMRGGSRDTARAQPEPAPRNATPAPRREAAPAPQRSEPQEREQENTAPRREPAPRAQARNDPRDIDESDPDDRGSYYRPRYRGYSRYPDYDDDRRYTRAPDPYGERPYRRRPGIWDPADDMDAYEEEYQRPISPFWGRPRPY
jgi:hypothetical protein